MPEVCASVPKRSGTTVSGHGGRRTVGVFPGDLSPPEPWRVFYLRFDGWGYGEHQKREVQVGRTTQAELEWVARTLIAELARRRKEEA